MKHFYLTQWITYSIWFYSCESSLPQNLSKRVFELRELYGSTIQLVWFWIDWKVLKYLFILGKINKKSYLIIVIFASALGRHLKTQLWRSMELASIPEGEFAFHPFTSVYPWRPLHASIVSRLQCPLNLVGLSHWSFLQ